MRRVGNESSKKSLLRQYLRGGGGGGGAGRGWGGWGGGVGVGVGLGGGGEGACGWGLWGGNDTSPLSSVEKQVSRYWSRQGIKKREKFLLHSPGTRGVRIGKMALSLT